MKPSSARARRRPNAPSTTRSAAACPTTRWSTATRAACPIRSGAWARSKGSTSAATRTAARRCSSGRACASATACARCRRAACASSTSQSPTPPSERAERFMTAAQRAMAEGEYELAAQRLVYARDAEPRNATVLRQMTLAFWNAGNLEAAGRAVRDWARVEERPGGASLRRAHLRGHGRDRPGRAGGRAGDRERAGRRRRHGSGWGGCAWRCSTARARSTRCGARWRWARTARRASCSCRRSRSSRAQRRRRRTQRRANGASGAQTPRSPRPHSAPVAEAASSPPSAAAA